MNMRYALLIIAIALAGCFYPPQQKPLAANSTEVTVALPYDLALGAVHAVIDDNDYRIIGENPDQGVIEAQTVGGFTLHDADCGKLAGIVGKYKAEPPPASSAVYDFRVKPQGKESSVIGVQATFTTPLFVPMHTPSDVQCVSLGLQEARLLKQISDQAAKTRRPEFKPPADTP
jgi:hypothetical protein